MLCVARVKRVMNVCSERRSRHSYRDQMIQKIRNSPISDCLSPADGQPSNWTERRNGQHTNDHRVGTIEALSRRGEFGVAETTSCWQRNRQQGERTECNNQMTGQLGRAEAHFDGCMSRGLLTLDSLLDCSDAWLKKFRHLRSAGIAH
jgi:hypothetical protein